MRRGTAGGAVVMNAALGGCGGGTEVRARRSAVRAGLCRIEPRMLDGDLVGFPVKLAGARGEADVTDYARCAAAQYTLIRGHDIARHVRTRVALEAGVWRADAVNTVSPALPQGLQTIGTAVAVGERNSRGIPTV